MMFFHPFFMFALLSSWQDGVNATFEVRNEGNPPSNKTVKAKLLIGADGIRSAVRKSLVGDEPRYLRCLNWNAIVPNPDRR